jgi:hypothetical protein
MPQFIKSKASNSKKSGRAFIDSGGNLWNYHSLRKLCCVYMMLISLKDLNRKATV